MKTAVPIRAADTIAASRRDDSIPPPRLGPTDRLSRRKPVSYALRRLLFTPDTACCRRCQGRDQARSLAFALPDDDGATLGKAPPIWSHGVCSRHTSRDINGLRVTRNEHARARRGPLSPTSTQNGCAQRRAGPREEDNEADTGMRRSTDLRGDTITPPGTGWWRERNRLERRRFRPGAGRFSCWSRP